MGCNRLKTLIAQEKLALGTYAFSGSPMFFEALVQTGLDFVIIETQHSSTSPWDVDLIANLCRIAERSNVTALVRVPDNDSTWIRKVLEAGADGVIVPHIETPEDAERMVDAAYFPPKGERGACPIVPANSFVRPNDAYMEESNRNILVVPLIEALAGVDNIEEIVEVPGINLVRIGGLDLALSVAGTSDSSHPDVASARERVMNACQRKRIPVCDNVRGPEGVKSAMVHGVKVLTYSTDLHVFYQAWTSEVNELRSSQT